MILGLNELLASGVLPNKIRQVFTPHGKGFQVESCSAKTDGTLSERYVRKINESKYGAVFYQTDIHPTSDWKYFRICILKQPIIEEKKNFKLIQFYNDSYELR